MASTVIDLITHLEKAMLDYNECQLWIFLESNEWQTFQSGCEDLMAFLEFSGHPLTASRVFQGFSDIATAAQQSDKDSWLEGCFGVQQKVAALLMRLKAISRSWNQLRPDSDIPIIPPQTGPSSKSKTTSKSDTVVQRSWTAVELNEAIREYRAKRASTIEHFVSILENPNATTSQKNRVRQNARKLFGRNAIARVLGVKSPRMVGESSAWKALAGMLQLPRKKDDPTRRSNQQTDHTDAPDIPATPRSAQKPYEADEASISADVLEMQQERDQTLKSIRKLATSGGNGTREQAKSILDAYNNDEMTDEQVRQTVAMLLEGV
jgi:hypothetical protein